MSDSSAPLPPQDPPPTPDPEERRLLTEGFDQRYKLDEETGIYTDVESGKAMVHEDGSPMGQNEILDLWQDELNPVKADDPDEDPFGEESDPEALIDY
jgi:hypothetical protein